MLFHYTYSFSLCCTCVPEMSSDGLLKKSNIIFITSSFAAAAKSLQSCPTLCDPMDCILPGFSIHGILQARTLEWVAISFSNACKWKVKVKSLSRVRLLATPWTAAYQAPLSMGFSRHEYWSGVPLPSPSVYTRAPKGMDKMGRATTFMMALKWTQHTCPSSG